MKQSHRLRLVGGNMWEKQFASPPLILNLVELQLCLFVLANQLDANCDGNVSALTRPLGFGVDSTNICQF